MIPGRILRELLIDLKSLEIVICYIEQVKYSSIFF